MVSIKRVFLVMMLAATAVGLAACGTPSTTSGGGANANAASPLTLEQAEQIAETFLNAWEKADYTTMYGLISPNSRDAYDETKFSAEYDQAATEVTLNSLDTNITSSLRQGTTAVVQYDAVFHSELFVDISDTARTMRLIETPEGWRVAWSRMDIFNDLAEGARLDRVQTMPNRGNIYDRNGKVLVDQQGKSIVIYIVKQDIANEDACMQLLSRIMRRDIGDLQTLFAQYYPETRFPVGELDPETYQAEESNLLQACAVGDDQFDTLTRQTRRYWGELAPHIIGYVSQIQPDQLAEYERKGYPQDALIGQTGIEKAYESYLAGKPGAELRIVAPSGETLRMLAKADPQPGQSVYLTIDRDLQEAVQNAIYEAYS
jgi:hypothetical protein